MSLELKSEGVMDDESGDDDRDELMSMQECVAKRKCKFLANYVKSDNILCYVCLNTATHELNYVRQTVTISF